MVQPIPVSGRRPYTSDMSSERFDWSERQASQPAPSPAGYAPAGPAHAGLAQAGPPAGQPGGSAPSALVVRTQRSEHTLQPGTVYRVGRDPKSDIFLNDSRVSWHHGVLRVNGDKWVFETAAAPTEPSSGSRRLTG